MNLKKIALPILFVAVVVAAGYLMYLLFLKPAGEEIIEPPVNVVTNEPITGLPTSGIGALPPGQTTGGLPTTGVIIPGEEVPTTVTPSVSAATEVVVSSPTVGATLTSSGSVNYYNRDDNKFYRLMPNGTVESLSNKQFYNVQTVTFEPSGNKAIMEYPDGSNILYDFGSGQQVTLPKHWESFDFSTSGDKIISKSVGLDYNNRFLVVSNPDGSEAKAVQELGNNADKVTVNWSPNNQVIAFSETAPDCGTDCAGVYLIGQNKENYKLLTVPGQGFQSQWSPNGNQLLFSVMSSTSNWKPQLWVVDAAPGSIGQNRRSISVNTWAEKCTFASTTVMYCAVPREMPVGAGLQPGTITSGDDIYSINLVTGTQKVVARPEGDRSFGEILLAPGSNKIYAADQTTGFLSAIEIEL